MALFRLRANCSTDCQVPLLEHLRPSLEGFASLNLGNRIALRTLKVRGPRNSGKSDEREKSARTRSDAKRVRDQQPTIPPPTLQTAHRRAAQGDRRHPQPDSGEAPSSNPARYGRTRSAPASPGYSKHLRLVGKPCRRAGESSTQARSAGHRKTRRAS